MRIEVDSEYLDRFLHLLYNFNNINNQGDPEAKVKIINSNIKDSPGNIVAKKKK